MENLNLLKTMSQCQLYNLRGKQTDQRRIDLINGELVKRGYWVEKNQEN